MQLLTAKLVQFIASLSSGRASRISSLDVRFITYKANSAGLQCNKGTKSWEKDKKDPYFELFRSPEDKLLTINIKELETYLSIPKKLASSRYKTTFLVLYHNTPSNNYGKFVLLVKRKFPT